MAAEHYLGDGRMIGESLRYVATVDGQWVALLAWAAAAWCCAPRDRWLGWPPHLRKRRLPYIVNNTRFLILNGMRIPNLASAVLAKNTKRLAADWGRVHHRSLLLAETFVDPARFTGTAYRAAGWLPLGLTRGFGRRGGHYVHHGQPKVIWVRPLAPDARTRLADPWTRPHQLGGALVPASQLQDLNWTGPGGLGERLGTIADPRHARGIRHQWVPILQLSCAAVLAGQKNFKEIAEWVGDLPSEILARFGARRVASGYQAPSEPTIRRALQQADADQVDAILGQWFADQGLGDVLSVDGKVLRGSGHGQPPVHLLSAVLHAEGVTVAQQAVPDKTNEIPGLRTLLEPLDIADKVVTADAMHAQDETARYLVEDKHADYVLQIKGNQPSLRDAVEAISPEDFSPPHVTLEQGHGRIERRSVSCSTVLNGYLDFPYAQQVIRAERTTWKCSEDEAARTPLSHEVSFYLSSLTPEQAAALRGPLPQNCTHDGYVAKANAEALGLIVRGHWGIESCHWIRDRDFREDESLVRRGSAPQVMASLRNCAISLLHRLAVPNVAAALRHLSRHPESICAILGV